MTDKEKIEKIMLDKHLNNTQFCNKVAITPGSLSHILSGRTNPTLPILRSIKFVFPDINPAWLFYDDGPMYINEVQDSEPSNAPSSSSFEDDDSSDEDPSGVFQADLFSQSISSSGKTKASKSPSPTDGFMPHSASSAALPVAGISEIVEQTVKQLQRPQRKIMEVRIFFDDGTFETFGTK